MEGEEAADRAPNLLVCVQGGGAGESQDCKLGPSRGPAPTPWWFSSPAAALGGAGPLIHVGVQPGGDTVFSPHGTESGGQPHIHRGSPCTEQKGLPLSRSPPTALRPSSTELDRRNSPEVSQGPPPVPRALPPWANSSWGPLCPPPLSSHLVCYDLPGGGREEPSRLLGFLWSLSKIQNAPKCPSEKAKHGTKESLRRTPHWAGRPSAWARSLAAAGCGLRGPGRCRQRAHNHLKYLEHVGEEGKCQTPAVPPGSPLHYVLPPDLSSPSPGA